ncbi:MAG: prephenate dehydrogenase/arogenate dehydrogenase family protein [Chloroflexota bacterium]|nr:prephenate dehydrogenase/arogenate dehydrogenase family protein [Chloroflexota bacterium]
MDFKRVAIIGTDYISVSIALGLKAQSRPPEIVGYGADRVATDLARAQGAFDWVERKPGQTCRDADLVIVARPLAVMRETLAAIALHLQPGCLVTDTAPLKTPVMRWADELLPPSVFFAGGHLVLNPVTVGLETLGGLDTARADLLTEALYCFTTPPGVPGEVISAFAGLAQMLDAHPFFIDDTEHDGLLAGIEGLPDLLAIALLRATVDTPGWQEMHKFAGQRFAVATEAAANAAERHTAVFLNREHILRRLNHLLTELVRLRDLLVQDDAGSLEETFVAAAEGRAHWLEGHGRGVWEQSVGVKVDRVPSASQQVRRMFFGERFAQRREEADPSREK